MNNIYVYVAGPLNSSGRQAQNTRRAVDMAEALLRAGFIPFVPHLYAAQWAFLHPEKEAAEWLALDFAWLEKCDAMIRLRGKSEGTEKEEEHARKHNIPILYEDIEGGYNSRIIYRLQQLLQNGVQKDDQHG